MLTSKQRAYLKGKASNMDSIFQVGKASVGENMAVQIGQALKKRELIKLNVLNNCLDDVRVVVTPKQLLRLKKNYYHILISMAVSLKEYLIRQTNICKVHKI